MDVRWIIFADDSKVTADSERDFFQMINACGKEGRPVVSNWIKTKAA